MKTDSAVGAEIVLVGAPGSGKSTVGELLAGRLGLDFCDVDAVIAYQSGKPIQEIFADDGEAFFRKLELDTTLRALQQPGVVSLGGGAVLAPEIRTALSSHRVVWLQVGVGAAARRVGLNEARPLLLGNVRGTLIKLLASRTPLYQEVSSLAVATDDLGPDQVVDLILADLGRADA